MMVILNTEVSSFQGRRDRDFTVHKGVLISGGWNRGVPLTRDTFLLGTILKRETTHLIKTQLFLERCVSKDRCTYMYVYLQSHKIEHGGNTSLPTTLSLSIQLLQRLTVPKLDLYLNPKLIKF